jgi:glycosyltransferase involved in cell wall biosynthesis
MVEAGESSPGPDGPVLFVGRLLKVKGVELLLEAMRYAEGARLVIIGDGPQREELERAARGLPVEFTGILPYEEVRRRMSQAAVLVQPSLAEGMPNTVLEAMAHGVPVVATAVAGLRDLMKDGENGFLIERRDPKLLGSRIAALLGDRALWSRISKACPETARSYSPEQVIPRLEETLREVIQESS